VLLTIAAGQAPGPVLDVYAHALSDDMGLLRALVKNEQCFDETVRWMARHLKGEILSTVAANQRRLIREPRIIEALINNPATPTPTLAPVLETAIRNNVNWGRIPGFKVLAEGFFGDLSALQDKGPTGEDEELKPEIDSKGDHAVLERLLRSGAEEAARRATTGEEGDDLDVDSLGEPEEAEKKDTLWAQIQEMGVAERIRLALMGDGTARAILVRDAKKLVAMAVLKSPRLTLKEVATFAQNKAISEDLIREIARNRDWTKNYTVRYALCRNPKCPPSQAMTFIRTLRGRDIKKLATARDVPAYVRRNAKGAMERSSGG
jgi:hypothetical protein